jgi:hypothetical protein
MAQITTSHSVTFESVLDRPLDSVYNEGGIDQYRMCEWGIMKRAVEADRGGLRRREIVALGASMSSFAIVVAADSKVYEPEMLKNKEIAVTPNNGSPLHDAETDGRVFWRSSTSRRRPRVQCRSASRP